MTTSIFLLVPGTQRSTSAGAHSTLHGVVFAILCPGPADANRFNSKPSCSRARPRHLGLLAGDELQQHRDAFLGLLDAAPDRGNDVFRFCHALAMAAEGACHRRV